VWTRWGWRLVGVGSEGRVTRLSGCRCGCGCGCGCTVWCLLVSLRDSDGGPLVRGVRPIQHKICGSEYYLFLLLFPRELQVGVLYVVQVNVSDATQSNVATTNITVASAGVALSVVGGTGGREIGTLTDFTLDASPTVDLDR
jgi:hypothetical protein